MAQSDAFTLLKADHDKFKKMFKDYEELGDRAIKGKTELSAKIMQELTVHEQIEEEILYPAIRKSADQEGIDMVLEGYEEHHVADMLIDEIGQMKVEDEHFDAKMKVLGESIEHHVDEEEKEMFPMAKKALGDTAVEIGEKMAARKDELMKEAREIGR